jgi:hypothetical protein
LDASLVRTGDKPKSIKIEKSVVKDRAKTYCPSCDGRMWFETYQKKINERIFWNVSAAVK